jgi:homeobox protein cut-like
MSDFQPNTRGPKPLEDASIVPILTSQRDRFKQRFEESHRNYLEVSSRLAGTQDELARTQQDNVSLYEKLKYQENFRQNQSVVDIDGGRRYEAASARYRDKYEETIDPFRHFKQVIFDISSNRKKIGEPRTSILPTVLQCKSPSF